MEIDFEKLRKAMDMINDLNAMDLKDVAKQLGDDIGFEIPQSIIDEWRFTGLNNEDFVNMITIDTAKSGTIYSTTHL